MKSLNLWGPEAVFNISSLVEQFKQELLVFFSIRLISIDS